jgi:hypothetical protein
VQQVSIETALAMNETSRGATNSKASHGLNNSTHRCLTDAARRGGPV